MKLFLAYFLMVFVVTLVVFPVLGQIPMTKSKVAAMSDARLLKVSGDACKSLQVKYQAAADADARLANRQAMAGMENDMGHAKAIETQRETANNKFELQRKPLMADAKLYLDEMDKRNLRNVPQHECLKSQTDHKEVGN